MTGRPSRSSEPSGQAAVEASDPRRRRARSELTPSCSPEPEQLPEPEPGVAEQPARGGGSVSVDQSAVAPAVLSYPSELHRAGRLMVMVAATSLCLYRCAGPLRLPPLPTLCLPPLDIETFVGGVRLSVI
ncbi:hypothetical protein FJT64_026480 [Amphibalanus amphitrite]|uniref:Uncharacterized protein n=1 Tax=Amphibalanus amphitrite TaxID=1232801 RepID=A0A6A4WBH3_AMPAM|nr:hypothetical protein FJT64_026480 [Amphibalanus amphitrite]